MINALRPVNTSPDLKLPIVPDPRQAEEWLVLYIVPTKDFLSLPRQLLGIVPCA